MQEAGELKKALGLLFDAVPADSSVILFGSRARGDARITSDWDFLVIEPQVDDRFMEMVRLSRLLGEALIPADVVVLSRSAFEAWRDEPNSLAGRALREGKVYDHAA